MQINGKAYRTIWFENNLVKNSYDSRRSIYVSKNIEKEMNLAADLLEFELAARLRDELKELRREINSITE